MLKKLATSGASLALVVTLAPGASATTIEEDSPRFNCYTMGNHDCGTAPVIKVRRGSKTIKVAVLERATNDKFYGSARSGRVIKLRASEVARVWLQCVEASDYSTRMLTSCDDRWGEHDARTL